MVLTHSETRPGILHTASRFGYGPTVRLLLRYVAEVNAKDDGGYYALGAASPAGQESMVRLLLENGADITWKFCLRCSEHVEQGMKHSCFCYLRNGANINNQTDNSPLQEATQIKHNPIVELLLEGGADTAPRRPQISPLSDGRKTRPPASNLAAEKQYTTSRV